MKVTVVSPTYNEAANVPRLVDEVAAALQGIDYELIIVDDNSPDGTWLIAQQMAKVDGRLRVIRRLKDRGLSAAVIDGFKSSTSECVAVIDADLQHDPAILRKMVTCLDGDIDIVVGSRYVSGGGTGTWNVVRRFESWAATKLAQLFLGVPLKDPMSGYFMLRRNKFDGIQHQLDTGGFKILLEIIARLGSAKVVEVPYTFRTRQAGRSKLSSKVVLQYVLQLWRLSSLSCYMSVRCIKFGLVGATGTVINLSAFSILSRLWGSHDWWISALASTIANFTNYIFNNIWTFKNLTHQGWSVVRGYITYFAVSAVGLVVSTATFAGLSALFQKYARVSAYGTGPRYLALYFQLIAILIGTFFNYELNKRFTWRGKSSDKAHASLRRSTLGKSCDTNL